MHMVNAVDGKGKCASQQTHRGILVEQNHEYHVSIKIEHIVSACNRILFTFQVTQSVG